MTVEVCMLPFLLL